MSESGIASPANVSPRSPRSRTHSRTASPRASPRGSFRATPSPGNGASATGLALPLTQLLGLPHKFAGIDFAGPICLAMLDVGTALWKVIAAPGSPQNSISPALSRTSSLSGSMDRSFVRSVPLARLQDLVNALYRSADATRASVHSVVGDTATLSWNATHRILQPENKALKFLAKMKKEAKEGDFEAVGAVCGGYALTTALTTTTKQQVVITGSKWLPALQGLFQLAYRHRALVCDGATANAAATDVRTHAVDSYSYYPLQPGSDDAFAKGGDPPIQSGKTFVDELCAGDAIKKTDPVPQGSGQLSRARVEVMEIDDVVQMDDDEWMYQLQKEDDQNKSGDFLIPALKAARSGEFSRAADLLRDLEGKKNVVPGAVAVLNSVLVMRFREAVDAQLAGSTA